MWGLAPIQKQVGGGRGRDRGQGRSWALARHPGGRGEGEPPVHPGTGHHRLGAPAPVAWGRRRDRAVHPGQLHRHETILLVEDAAIVRRLVARMLDSLGYRVLQAEGPEEALGLFTEHTDRVDLLLTDVIMPVMNGKQLYDMLSELRPELPVLFMSGYPADIIGPHGVLDEGIHFLQKPFGADELALKLRETLEDLRPLDPAATP